MHEETQGGCLKILSETLCRTSRAKNGASAFVFLPQVLSHNLYTVLNIPHDPVALEEHFQDDDDGPVSNHGYMPYLNKYILDKVGCCSDTCLFFAAVILMHWKSMTLKSVWCANTWIVLF